MKEKAPKKKRHSFPIKFLCQALAVILVVVSVTMFKTRDAQAVFDSSKAVLFRDYSASHEIEQSVLFIGTYLIHKDALTDALYDKAKDSASDANQNDVYYKSELANGSWFNIGGGGSLKDITTQGTIVPESELADLYVQYYVGSDGKMVDAKTGATQNPFNTPDPYDLSKLKELNAIWKQYAMADGAESVTEDEYLNSKNAKGSGNVRLHVYYYQILTTFFGLDLRDSETDGYDRDIERLNACYNSLKSSGMDEEADIVYGLMEKVDASRRALIMAKLSSQETNALNILYNLANGSNYTSYGDFKDYDSDDVASTDISWARELQNSLSHSFNENRFGIYWFQWPSGRGWWNPIEEFEREKLNRNTTSSSSDEDEDEDEDEEEEEEDKYTETDYPFSPDSSILEAIGTAIQECQQSYNNYQSASLSDKDTVLGHAEYEYGRRVVEEASADGSAGPINNLKHIQNIAEGIVKDASAELNLLDSSLVDLAGSAYETAVTQGESQSYKTVKADGGGAEAADSELNKEKDEVDAKRSELEYLINAKKERDTAPNSMEFIYGRIDWTNRLYNEIPLDDFADKAKGTVDSHMKFLKETASEVKSGDESLKSDLDKLKDEKSEKQQERDAAVDDNDLAGAAKLDKEIEALDKDIADEEQRLAAKLEQDKAAGSAADAARAGSDLGNSLKGVVDQMVDKAKDKLAKDGGADISSIASALADLGETAALQDVVNTAKAAGASAKDMNSLNNTLNEAKANAAANASAGGSGGGAGAGGAGAGGAGAGADGAGGVGGSGAGGAGGSVAPARESASEKMKK
ncbi:MAG: hypothetical protein J6O55_03620, partial [Lachnospiraceae bacterium]|nr:hypothetical protein [Lachnospiraceae bacterium]